MALLNIHISYSTNSRHFISAVYVLNAWYLVSGIFRHHCLCCFKLGQNIHFYNNIRILMVSAVQIWVFFFSGLDEGIIPTKCDDEVQITLERVFEIGNAKSTCQSTSIYTQYNLRTILHLWKFPINLSSLYAVCTISCVYTRYMPIRLFWW